MSEIDRKDRALADSWVQDMDPNRAVIASGKKPKRQECAETVAWTVLRRPEILDHLEAEHTAFDNIWRVKKHHLTRNLVPLAQSNMGDYFNDQGDLKPMDELTRDQQSCIKRYKVKITTRITDNSETTIIDKDIELWDKLKANAQLDSLHGLSKQEAISYEDNREDDLVSDMLGFMREQKQREDEIESLIAEFYNDPSESENTD